MEDLFRAYMHDALDVEPPPAYLHARVVSALPAADRRVKRQVPYFPRVAGRTLASVLAVLVALAIVAGLLDFRAHFAPNVPVRPLPTSPGRLISPEGVAVGSDGSVYLSDFLGDRVFKVLPDGKVILLAGGGHGGDGPAIKAWLNHPIGLAIDRNGNVFVADGPGSAIRKIDRRGVISTLAFRDESGAPDRLTGVPTGLAFDSSGQLWVSEFYGKIRRIDSNGVSSILDTSAVPPPVLVPGYMTFDSAGNLYFSDRRFGVSDNPIYTNPIGGGCRIIRVTPDRKLSVVAGTGVCGFSGDGGPATSAQLGDPNGLAFDSAGNLYVADANNHRIRRIDKSGTITTVAGTGVAGFSGDGGPAAQAQLEYPFGLGITSGGLLYFSDATCSCWDPAVPGHLRVVKLSDGTINTVMSSRTPVQTAG